MTVGKTDTFPKYDKHLILGIAIPFIHNEMPISQFKEYSFSHGQ
jgi:hypothetical protein